MAAVNWDQPSTGLVSDAAPALLLENDKGEAVNARSRDVAIDAESKEAEALRARTVKTLAAHIRSEEFIGAISYGPKATGAIGVNEAATVALGGVNLVDPAKPADSRDGIGVAGLSNRAVAYGVVGATFGVRSTGVLGNALGGGVGVRGIGSQGGVEGASSQSHGVSGTSQSNAAAGVFGFAPGPQGGGVFGQSTAGAGVDGSSNAGTGVRGTSVQAGGVVGESTGSNASGVFYANDLGNGVGVDGYSQAGTAMRATSSSGTGLQVQSLSGGGIDVTNTSTSKPALEAYSPGKPAIDAMSLTDAGARASSAHAGVVGVSIGPSKPSDPEAGCGVYGNSIGATGACGITLIGTGVLGIGLPQLNAWAGRFVGNVHIDGMLFKSVSLFSIDHPLDPKRKVLNHASVESPEYKTFYDGTVTLDRRGQGTIKLPRWFDALNHDLRYQLTAIGANGAGAARRARGQGRLVRHRRRPAPPARGLAGHRRAARCLGEGPSDAGRAGACQGPVTGACGDAGRREARRRARREDRQGAARQGKDTAQGCPAARGSASGGDQGARAKRRRENDTRGAGPAARDRAVAADAEALIRHVGPGRQVGPAGKSGPAGTPPRSHALGVQLRPISMRRISLVPAPIS